MLQLFLEWRWWRIRAQLGDEFLVSLDIGSDCFTVIVVITQCGVNIGKRQSGVSGDDLVRSHSHALVPDNDVLDLNAMAQDMWLSTTRARRNSNVFANDWWHLRVRSLRWLSHKEIILDDSSKRKAIVPAYPITPYAYGVFTKSFSSNRPSRSAEISSVFAAPSTISSAIN